MLSVDQISNKVNIANRSQDLNNQAMAAIFKVMKLDYALAA